MIKTKNLKFLDFLSYQDIEIKKSKVNFISGDSGTGKSTLLKLFNRTLEPSRGEIYINSENINNFDTLTLRKNVFLVAQTSFLFDQTILENFNTFLSFVDKNHSVSSETATIFLDLCKISVDLNSKSTTLSGGEKQRVYLAINLFLSEYLNTKVLMLDEPTSALDKSTSHNLIANIIDFCKKKEKTLIIISHDKEIMDNFSENTIILGGKNGQ